MEEDKFEDYMKTRMKEINADLKAFELLEDDEQDEEFKWISRGLLSGFAQCLNSYQFIKYHGEKQMNETWMQVIAIIGSNLIIMLTFFGVSISLHNGIREEIRGIQEEIRDFHGRLCAIEERNKK